jgi:hypothetical protein
MYLEGMGIGFSPYAPLRKEKNRLQRIRRVQLCGQTFAITYASVA